MSLLLDALKKAEKAKEDAKRRADLSGEGGMADAGLHVRTRNELPDISKPLDINSDDLSAGSPSSSAVPDAFSTAPPTRSAPPAPPVIEPKAKESPAETVPRQRPPASAPEDRGEAPAAQRAAAKKVFEAKFREPNPKLPFYITMAVLGLFSVGTVIYFWYQLRPPPPLVNSNPKPPGDEKKLEPPPQEAAIKPLTAAPTAPSDIPGLPGQSGASAPAKATTVAPGVQSPVTPATPAAPAASAMAPTGLAVQKPAPVAEAPKSLPARQAAPPASSVPAPQPSGAPSRAARAPTASAAARPAADPSRVNVNRAGPRVDPRIEAAWQAYNEGDLKSARANYQAMLKDDPTHRDALLGMAAVEVRSNRFEQAAGYYQLLLQASPRDTLAQAGLLSLRAQMGDTVQAESRVKSMIASDPDAQVLYFTLGNQYAQQGRWPEAQQAFFKAYSAEPENPDFAYNLAVSLDQVRQPKLALEYYRRALSLAQQRASSFDQSLARTRVQELSR